MPQSFAQIIVHLVFSTKDRRPFICEDVASKLYAYMAGLLNEQACEAILIGGMEEHVHVLFGLSKNAAPVKIVEELKKSSSKWMKTQGESFALFQWQRGYGMFSVSQSNVEAVKEYIARQDEHHTRRSFQDELRELLERHGMEFSERYLWD